MQDVQEDPQRLCRRYITRICEACGPHEPGTRPLNILIVGKQSCGKSSFIDSVAAALSGDRWVEHTYVGNRNQAMPVTNFILRKPGTSMRVGSWMRLYCDRRSLQHLLYMQNEESGLRAYRDCQMDWDDLLVKYNRAYDDMKVDRVIFVASIVDSLPRPLMECVMNAFRPTQGFNRQVPVFGVMTKMDRVNDENRTQFEAKKREFKSALGLHEGRLLCCSNYCDDTDPDQVRQDRLIPDLDLPILRFFREVCERNLRIINQDEVIRVSFPRRLQAFWPYFAVLLIACLLYFVLFPPNYCGTAKEPGDVSYELCVAIHSYMLHVATVFVLVAFFALFLYVLLRGLFQKLQPK